MPAIDRFKCDSCDFEMPAGWGGYIYVTDGDRKRVGCRHPTESSTIAKVISGIDPQYEAEMKIYSSHLLYGWNLMKRRWKARRRREAVPLDIRVIINSRIGLSAYCICRRCLSQLNMDLRRDERVCPECGSQNLNSGHELVGGECPKCRKGKVRRISTGLMA
jgi:ssDNA-binding Zn-finger/Zn-ribbon topoisomerase 1